MREIKMRYVNHRGDVFTFGEKAGAFLCDFDELLSYEHPIKPKDANLTVVFDGTVPESRGRFFQIVEVDSLAEKEGELWFDDCFIKGRVIAGGATLHYGQGEMTKAVKFSMQEPIWTRSVTKLYERTQTKALIINEGFFESPVMIEAFGEADGFSVSIGDNNYDVAQNIPEGSRARGQRPNQDHRACWCRWQRPERPVEAGGRANQGFWALRLPEDSPWRQRAYVASQP